MKKTITVDDPIKWGSDFDREYLLKKFGKEELTLDEVLTSSMEGVEKIWILLRDEIFTKEQILKFNNSIVEEHKEKRNELHLVLGSIGYNEAKEDNLLSDITVINSEIARKNSDLIRADLSLLSAIKAAKEVYEVDESDNDKADRMSTIAAASADTKETWNQLSKIHELINE